MDTISLEELLPAVHSVPHAQDLRGAVFLRHDLYMKAGREFHKAVKADPQDVVHRLWSGVLFPQVGQFQNANERFSGIPREHALYEDSLKAIELTSMFQAVDREDEAALTEIRRHSSMQYRRLLDLTFDLATGQTSS